MKPNLFRQWNFFQRGKCERSILLYPAQINEPSIFFFDGDILAHHDSLGSALALGIAAAKAFPRHAFVLCSRDAITLRSRMRERGGTLRLAGQLAPRLMRDRDLPAIATSDALDIAWPLPNVLLGWSAARFPAAVDPMAHLDALCAIPAAGRVVEIQAGAAEFEWGTRALGAEFLPAGDSRGDVIETAEAMKRMIHWIVLAPDVAQDRAEREYGRCIESATPVYHAAQRIEHFPALDHPAFAYPSPEWDLAFPNRREPPVPSGTIVRVSGEAMARADDSGAIAVRGGVVMPLGDAELDEVPPGEPPAPAAVFTPSVGALAFAPLGEGAAERFRRAYECAPPFPPALPGLEDVTAADHDLLKRLGAHPDDEPANRPADMRRAEHQSEAGVNICVACADPFDAIYPPAARLLGDPICPACLAKIQNLRAAVESAGGDLIAWRRGPADIVVEAIFSEGSRRLNFANRRRDCMPIARAIAAAESIGRAGDVAATDPRGSDSAGRDANPADDASGGAEGR